MTAPAADDDALARDPRRPVGFDLRLIEAFLTLAEELHFGRAAERLGFAQPALSRQVGRLEAQLGVRLFERNAHGVRLTAAGAAVRPALAASLTAALDAAEVARGLGGRLSLAMAQGTLVLIDDLLRSFAAEHPQVRIDVASMTDAANADAVRDGHADAAVLWSSDAAPEGFGPTAVLVRDSPAGVWLRASHPLAGLAVVPRARLRDHRLVMFPRDAGPAQFDRIVADLGGPERPGGVQEVPMLGPARAETIRALDDRSFAVGPLARDEDDRDDVVVRPVEPPLPSARLWLVWRGRPRGPAGALVAHVRATVTPPALR